MYEHRAAMALFMRSQVLREPPYLSAKFQLYHGSWLAERRQFASTPRRRLDKRVYENIRSPSELDTLTLLSASSRTALITLWTASWCPSCRIVAPIVREVIEEGWTSPNVSDVGYAEVEFGSPDIGDLAQRYMITGIPTLLSFSRQEAQLRTRLTNVDVMRDKAALRKWLEEEAGRGATGGKGGSSSLGALFGWENKS